MLEYLDGTDLHNTLRLLLKGGTKKIIVVEGEDDYDLLIEAFEDSDVAIVPGYGKPKTLQAALEAHRDGTDPVRFLLDADFDRLTSADAHYPSNVVATTYYDLAMDTVEHLTSIVPRIARLASGQAESAQLDVDTQVALTYAIAEQFGAVRYASHVEVWNLSFEVFPFHLHLPTQGSDEIDLPGIVAMLVSRTDKCTLDPESLCSSVPTHTERIDNQRRLVNSHDLFDILLHVGRKFGGAKSNTGYETQFKLAAAGSMTDVPVVRQLVEWAKAA